MADGDYISIADTETLLDRVLAIYKVSGTVVESHLTLVIDEAEGMVNAAIASRYALPITDATAIKYIRSLLVPIIRYKSFTQFADQEDFPEGIKVEYKATMTQLDNLAKRITSLPNVDDKTTGRASYIKISTSTSPISEY